jgi:hypothetical protein
LDLRPGPLYCLPAELLYPFLVRRFTPSDRRLRLKKSIEDKRQACVLTVGLMASASAQTVVNVPAGGDVVGAAYQVLAAGGGTINLAAGTYNITQAIVLGPNTTLNGAGGPGSATQTVIVAPASPNAISMVTQAYPGASNLAVSNLVLEGNIPQAAMLYGTGNDTAYANPPYNNNGIYIYDTNSTTVGVTLTNVEVRHTLRGILTGLVDNLTISGCYFHDNNPGGFSHNMYLVATSGVEIDHTRSNDALTGDGLHFDFGGFAYTIRKSEFSGNNGLGILSQDMSNVTIEDSKLNFNRNEGILATNTSGLLFTRDEMSYNVSYGFDVPGTPDNNGLVNGVYAVQDDDLGSGANFVIGAGLANYTEGNPGANTYAAIQAYGVIGVADTADWTLNYPGYSYVGAVDFNANHLSNGSITFRYVGATLEGTPGSGFGYYPLNFRYSNGTSANQTLNLSVNGGAAVPLSFPPTGSYSTWATVQSVQALNIGNNTVTLSVPAGATSAPELDVMTVTTPTPNAPNAPTNVQGVATGPYSVKLTWTAPANSNNNAPQTYNIYKNNTVPIVATKITGTTWTDTRIFYGETTNQYFVTAVNQGGESGASNTVSVTTGIDAPPGLQVSVAPSTPANNLSWLGVSGAASYLVRRSTVSGGPYQTVATIAANGANNSYSDTSLGHGVNYFYVVAAADASGNISVNSYEVQALSQSFTLTVASSSVNLASSTSGTDTITVVRTNGFSDNVSFSASGLPSGVTAAFGGSTANTVQLTLTASSSATLGSYPIAITGTDGGLSSSVGITVNIGLAQTITFNAIPAQAIGNSLTLVATASSGLPVTFVPVPNGNCSVSGNVVTFLNAGNCGINAYQYGNATYGAAPSVGQIIVVNSPMAQTITFNAIASQTAGTSLTLTATASSGLPVSYASSTQSVCTVTGSTATLLAAGTCTIVASQAGAGAYGPAANVTQSFTVVTAIPTDLAGGRFARNCGNATAVQIFDSALLSSAYGVSNLIAISDPDIVLIGNQWWMIFAGGPAYPRVLAPMAAYLPPGASLSTSTTYPADPNGWRFVGAQSNGQGSIYPLNATASSWDAVAAETPSAEVGSDGTVSVYYSGHNTGQTNFEIGIQTQFANGLANGNPNPVLVAQNPWEFSSGLGATLEPSVRWMPQLNKYIMYYTAGAWWGNPPDNTLAYAESTDGINWVNRQSLNSPVSYYNQDFLYNPTRNRYEMVIANDPIGAGGANPRNLVWREAATPATSFSSWVNEVTLLQYDAPNNASWYNSGALSPAVKYGNLPGEENRMYVFFHSYSQSGDLSFGRFYCDATNSNSFSLSVASQTITLQPNNGTTDALSVVAAGAFSGTVSFSASTLPAGVGLTFLPATTSSSTQIVVFANANTVPGTYPITITGTSGTLSASVMVTLNVVQQTQTITFGPIATQTAGTTLLLGATASSGLPVSYTSTTTQSVCTVTGSTVTLLTAGTCTIVASQAGSGAYGPAPNVTQSFSVVTQTQTISFTPASPVVYGVAPLALNAAASSGLPVSYSVVSGPGRLSGSTLTVTGAGVIALTANQAGNSSYSAAPPVTASITVTPAPITVTVNSAMKVYGATLPTFAGTLGATQNGDALSVSYSTTATAASGVGAYPITATLAGTAAANYTTTVTPGVLTVTAATLTATANNINTTYGAAFTPTGSLRGLVAPDTFTESFTTNAGATTPVPAGTYTITPTVTATGGTNAANYSLSPVTGTLVVAKAGTTTQLVSSTANANSGATINFTATVSSLTSGTPTQTVTLMDGMSGLATTTLNAGVATFSISSLGPGAHSIVALYNGDPNFLGSSSAAVSATVATPSFSVSVAPSSLSIVQGQSGSLVMTVTGAGGYAGTVKASCASSSQLPCSYAPSTLTFTGANSTQTITVTVGTTSQARLIGPRDHGQRVFAAMFLWLPGLLAGMSLLRRRRVWRAAMGLGALLVLLGLGGLVGCGGTVSASLAAKGSYTFPIVVSDGTITASQAVTVIVQ